VRKLLRKQPLGRPRRLTLSWILGSWVVTKVDIHGSGLCPLAGCGISSVEPMGSATV